MNTLLKKSGKNQNKYSLHIALLSQSDRPMEAVSVNVWIVALAPNCPSSFFVTTLIAATMPVTSSHIRK